jgi:hypothetical protein
MTTARTDNRPLISKRHAISLIPMSDRESREFLIEENLIHQVRGRDFVVLRDLEAAVRQFDHQGKRQRSL